MDKEKITPQILKIIEELECDFNELWNTGKIQAAEELNKNLTEEKYKLCYSSVTAPFFGDLMSEYVVVNLNPGVAKGDGETREKLEKKGISNFESYYDYLRNYGEYHFGKDDSKADKFDARMVGILAPFDELDNQFGFIRMKDEKETQNDLGNLVKVIQNKCQLEFIKYGSPQFNKKDFLKQPWVLQRMEEILDIIFSTERKRVFFNGAIFIDLLKQLQNENIKLGKEIKCKLKKDDDKECKNSCIYAICQITRYGQTIKCVINKSFYGYSFYSFKAREEFSKIIIKNEFLNK